MSVPVEAVRELEEQAFRAWPALETLTIEGWLLRFADGHTKRANSVNALMPRIPVTGILPIAELHFATRRLPLVFRLSPLAGTVADAILAAHGFQFLDETIVMTALIAANAADDGQASISAEFEAPWSTGFAAANRVPTAHHATHNRMLAAIPAATGFATLEAGGRPIAWGLGVAGGGMVGLFDIVTAAEARRQGAARRLVRALLAWGSRHGAGRAYLQVATTNTPAIALYQGLGFAEAYRYHYRIQPT